MTTFEGLKTWAQEIDKGTDTVKYLPLYDKYRASNATQTETHDFQLPQVTPNEKSTMTDELRNVNPRPSISRAYSSMDEGMSNNYYQRMSVSRSVDPYAYTRQLQSPNKMYQEPGPPTFRSGRLGAPWRHVRQCTGNLGNHICFIDGVVKNDDMKRYPPFGYLQAQENHSSYLPPFLEASKRQALGAKPGPNNRFQNHAKKGFKYWYEEKVPMAEQVLPKRTIQGRLMRLGVGH